jgi:hypothetical protein
MTDLTETASSMESSTVLERLALPAQQMLLRAELLEDVACKEAPPTVCAASRRVLKALRDLHKALDDPRPPQVRWREANLAKGLCCRCGSHKIAEGRSGKLCRGCLNRLRDNMRARRERAAQT